MSLAQMLNNGFASKRHQRKRFSHQRNWPLNAISASVFRISAIGQ